MKFLVVGAGSVGGYLAVRLAIAGHEVSVLARGAHLDAIRSNGLRIEKRNGEVMTAPPIVASDSLDGLPKQDVIIIALKAHQISAVAASVGSLIGPQTLVLPLQNGIPWWYFEKLDGPFAARRLESVDPGGEIARHIPADHVIGCVTWGAYDVAQPGVVHNEDQAADRFPVGELDGSRSSRLLQLSAVLEEAKIRAPVTDSIRSEKWLKAWGNLALNPIGALCHAPLGEIHAFEPTRHLAAEMMREAQAVAQSLGIEFPVSLEKRLARAAELGDVPTSTQQDVEAGRPLEVDALVGAVIEMGQLTGVATPMLGAMYACVQLLDRMMARGGLAFPGVPLARALVSQK